MTQFFKPYEGTRPYFFISYAHAQSEAVVSTIRILHEKGYRLWYDEGIPAGSDWPSNIARHMDACSRVIFFLSEASLASPNCLSEIRQALRLRKPVLIVPLEETGGKPAWNKLLEGAAALPLTEGPEKRAEAIVQSRFLSARYKKGPLEALPAGILPLILSLFFFLASAAFFFTLRAGIWDPWKSRAKPPSSQAETAEEEETQEAPPQVVDLGEAEKFFPVEFPDSLQERAVRKALSKKKDVITRGMLSDLDRLYLCGTLTADDLAGVSFDQEGVCRVYGTEAGTGPVTDLSLLTYAVRLQSLALICQPLEDLTPLGGHALLEELYLSGSSLTDPLTLSGLPSLRVLDIRHTGLKDLSSLEDLPRLQRVCVSRDMLPLSWNENAGFDLILVP